MRRDPTETLRDLSPALSRDFTLQIHPALRLLVLASGVCVGMVLVRFAYVGTLRFRFCGLLLNLLLAWVPLVMSVIVRHRAVRGRPILLCICGMGWLLFFPNTFYITTDLIHTNRFGLDRVYWWYDHLMTAGFAAAGMFLGSISLHVIHGLVRHRCGRIVGWVFACATLALGSFGIYLGRFLRFNSWDALLRPKQIVTEIAQLAAAPGFAEVAAFCGAFSAFSFAAYVFTIAATRLPCAPASTVPT